MFENTTEKFIVLVHHPQKSKFRVSEFVKRAGIIGSILLDLSLEKKIELEEKRLRVLSSNTNISPAHKAVLGMLFTSSKSRKIKTWITKLSKHSRKLQKGILLGLKAKGVFEINEKKILFFNYYKSSLSNYDAWAELVNEIREIIFNNKKAEQDDIALLGLVEACSLHAIICLNRKEKKICKSKLKEIIKSDEISQGVNKIIKEMQAAVTAAIVASVAASSAASN